MDKFQFVKAIIFATDEHRFAPQDPNSHGRQAEVLLPVEAISHLIQKEKGNPRSSYIVCFKKGYPTNPPFPVKSISTVLLLPEQVEVINQRNG